MPVTLWALSDLHVGYESNRRAIEALPDFGDDWLLLGGDTGDTLAQLTAVLDVVTRRFARVVWTPGNHDLWTPRHWPDERRGAAHYARLVDTCRAYGVATPEDPYLVWPATGHVLAPIFTLYDYSFGPPGLSPDAAVAWAAETNVRCADELLLSAAPFPSRAAWCAARVVATEARLAAVSDSARLVLLSHFPLRPDLAVLPRVPRFTIWCGTTRTADWHTRFPVDVVVSGHLHIRTTQWRDGVRFEEVSLGYPPQWDAARGAAHYVRPILPAPPALDGRAGPGTIVRHR